MSMSEIFIIGMIDFTNLSPLFMRELFNLKNVTSNTTSNATIDIDNDNKTYCTSKIILKPLKETPQALTYKPE